MAAQSDLRRILVTGGNKGIGEACVRMILKHQNTFVYLGSRVASRGIEARDQIYKEHPDWQQRIEVIEIDVSSDDSVATAAETVRQQLAQDELYGIVNNAGVGSGNLRDVLNINVRGIKRVTDAFVPLLDQEHGRVVNVASGVGPSYVAEVTNQHWKRVLTRPKSWAEIENFMAACEQVKGGEAGFREAGLGSGGAYSISKAAVNAVTVVQSRELPKLVVNSFSPGFIATDMTRQMVGGGDPTAKGAKPPSEAVKAPERLLFDVPAPPDGSGHYYGSDAERSPLDSYRSPGDPPYTGDKK